MLTKSTNVKVNLDLPEGISKQAREDAEQQAHEVVVLSLWEAGELSTREAAEELGLTYYEFLDLLAEKGIPYERGTFNAEAVEAALKQFPD